MITLILEPVIWYIYNESDEICWDGKQYTSLLSGGSFDTLEELDNFWKDFGHV